MQIEFSKRGPAIRDADVDAFEARIGRILPPDYRGFLLAYNGGRPSSHVIRNVETSDLGVQLFYGIWSNEHFDIDAVNCRMKDRWPSRFIAIAIDDFGNRFCLSLGPPDAGSVYFWNHEEEADEGEEPTELNLYHLADSFAEFWERMEPIDSDIYLAEKEAELNREPEPPQSPRANGAPH